MAMSTSSKPAWSLIGQRPVVRIDDLATLELRRVDDRFLARIAEFVDAVAFDVLELRGERPLFRPFSMRAKFHITNDGLERRLAHVVGELVVIQALRGGDCIAEYLQIGIGPYRHVVAERVGTGRSRALLVFFEELRGTGEIHRFYRQPSLIIDDAVE